MMDCEVVQFSKQCFKYRILITTYSSGSPMKFDFSMPAIKRSNEETIFKLQLHKCFKEDFSLLKT